MRDPYLYPDSEVLKNLAGIQDEQMLKDMEADYTLYRLSEIVTDADWMKFDFNSLCKMHYHIFQDIYEWAGCPRIINIEKAEAVLGELSIEYSDCYDIKKDAVLVLSEMNAFHWRTAEFDQVVEKFSDCMARLWKCTLTGKEILGQSSHSAPCLSRHRESILRVICLKIMHPI